MIHIQSALAIYSEHLVDFNYELECHLLNGIVFSDDKTFMLAIPCDSENPEIQVPIDNARSNASDLELPLVRHLARARPLRSHCYQKTPETP